MSDFAGTVSTRDPNYNARAGDTFPFRHSLPILFSSAGGHGFRMASVLTRKRSSQEVQPPGVTPISKPSCFRPPVQISAPS